MKILNTEQIRNIDKLTISQNNIASYELMEHAAEQLFHYIHTHYAYHTCFSIICGNGNNGGDGLALGRMLWQQGYLVNIYLCSFSDNYSQDNQHNQTQLKSLGIPIHKIDNAENIQYIGQYDIIIDAIFGSGLNRPLEGHYAKLIDNINARDNQIIAIDLPSGLFSDKYQPIDNSIIRANITLSFQIPKWALFLPQNSKFIGQWHLLNIGLNEQAIQQQPSKDTLITPELISSFYTPRDKFAHKGTNGHTLIVAGSYGKIGALILSSKACLRSGSGLTTAYGPACAYTPMQCSVAEVMFLGDTNHEFISDIPNLHPYNSIAVGPGIDTEEHSINALNKLLPQARQSDKKLLLDADALNIMAMQPNLLNQLYPNCILTPHPKEFARLAGESDNDYIRIEKLRNFAIRFNCIVVLKGRHTCIADNQGNIYVNNNGNAGLAKGGSGDTLSGIIAALNAQGYTSIQSALMGVYLHGLAADIALQSIAIESLLPSDVTEHLSQAFATLAL